MDNYMGRERLITIAKGQRTLIALLLGLLVVSIIVNIVSLAVKEHSVKERVDMEVRNSYPEIIWERDTAILDYAALIEAVEKNCTDAVVKRIYDDEARIRQEGLK